MNLHVFLCPIEEQLFHYFNNFVSHKKAKKLIPASFARYICLVTIEIAGHDENFDCHFFKCWI